jgi:hypothetical protein
MSAIGTKQTWASAKHMSAFGPKRTSVAPDVGLMGKAGEDIAGWGRGDAWVCLLNIRLPDQPNLGGQIRHPTA